MFVFFKVIIFLFPSDAILLITIFIFITRAKYFWERMIHLGLLGTIWQWMKFKSTDIFILSLSWISFPGRCSFIIYGSPLLFSADNFISLYFPRGSRKSARTWNAKFRVADTIPRFRRRGDSTWSGWKKGNKKKGLGEVGFGKATVKSGIR